MADAADSVIGNLPAQLTRLVDRRDALGELVSLIWRTRLLTLSGPGGAGKTRLAIALAENVRADFVGGAWWVDLSATVDSASVAQVIASTLLPGEPANDPTPAALARRFDESSLLVLDNCDQVLPGCADVVMSLLARSQSLRVLATSRQPLGVPGEQIFRVPGLAVEEEADRPDGAGPDGSGGASSCSLSALAKPRARLTRRDQACARRLGRFASGLTACRSRSSCGGAGPGPRRGPDRRASRARLELPAPLERAAPARHRTLQETLDWSHQLLEPSEQRLLRRLSAFRGGFSLGAAEAVCADAALEADACST